MRTSFIIASSLLVATYASAQNANQTILELAAGNANLSSLAGLATGKGFESVAELLKGDGPYTVFAPNNDAIKAANLNTSDTDYLLSVLQYHVIKSAIPSSALKPLQFPETLLTNQTLVNLDGKGQVLGISSDNATGVSVSFGTDAAKVVTADVTASNGVVHIVDKLLLPPKKPSETAVAAGTFSKLVEALNKVNLTNTIDTTKTLTIFAPNDDAFAKLGDKAASLTPEQLKDILSLHVVPSVAYSTDVKSGESVESLQGGKLVFAINGQDVSVNGAKIVKTDILTSNGVIHVIDTVLVPGSENNTAAKAAAGASGTNTTAATASSSTKTYASALTALAAFMAVSLLVIA